MARVSTSDVDRSAGAPARGTLSERFRQGFRGHAAAVALVCAPTPRGPVGVTVSSLASVSADPAMVSFSVDQRSATGGRIVESERLGVYLLTAGQAGLATAFATSGAERFTAEQGWRWQADDDLPRLAEASATLLGRRHRVVPAGASWLVLVEVDDVLPGHAGPPLLHHDRRYWTPGPVPADVSRLRAVPRRS